MANTTLQIAPRGATLCAVYNAAAGEIEDKLEARRVPDQSMIEGDRYFVPLGVEGIAQGDWESLRPEVEGIVRGHYDALKAGDISPFDIDLWSNCTERAAPVHRAGDVLSVEPDEDRDFVVHVENPYRRAELLGAIEPHTSDATLASIAAEIQNLVAEQGEFLVGVEGWLEGCRDLERESCPEWGEMSPYLEALLLQENPRIRLKNQGKFNPGGRRIVLIQVREAYGDGGWEPAVLDVSDEARQQWASAGIPFPAGLLQRLADRAKRDCTRQRDIKSGSRAVIGEVQSMLVEEKRIRVSLAERQVAYREAVVAQCQDLLAGVLGKDMNSELPGGVLAPVQLKNAYVMVTCAIQQLAALPAVELNPGLVRHASLDGVWQATAADLETAKHACGGLLDVLEGEHADSATRSLRELLERTNSVFEVQ